METDILKKAGLTDSQAKVYLTLVKNGGLTPAELAELSGETRTNAYAIVERLEKLGLAIKKADVSKATYIAAHPSALEELAEKRRKVVSKNEQEIKQNISSLINLFYTYNELPGTRTLDGIDGIKTVYKDTLKDKKDIFFLRTTADTNYLDNEFWNNYRKDRADAGINTYGLTQDTEIGRHNQKEDAQMLFHRTFLPKSGYTAPVEIDVYGDKVAFIAFGETQMATIVNSPMIAEAMRQILKLITSLIQQQESKN